MTRWPALPPAWIIPVVELGIRCDCRTADEQEALKKLAIVVDGGIAEAVYGNPNSFTRRVHDSWTSKPCLSCPPGVRAVLAIDGPDHCPTCLTLADLEARI